MEAEEGEHRTRWWHNKNYLRFVIGTIVLLVALVLLLVLVFAVDWSGCSPYGHIKQSPKQLAASTDFTSLVQISGYIEYLDKPKGFLPFSLKKVYVNSNSNFMLDFDCFALNGTMSKTGAGNDTKVHAFNTRLLVFGEENQGADALYCSASDIDFIWKLSARFYCPKKSVYKCTRSQMDPDGSYEKLVALVVFDYLEWEVEGNQLIIEHKQFDKEPQWACNY